MNVAHRLDKLEQQQHAAACVQPIRVIDRNAATWTQAAEDSVFAELAQVPPDGPIRVVIVEKPVCVQSHTVSTR